MTGPAHASALGGPVRSRAVLLASPAWAPVPMLVVGWAVFAQVVSFRGLLAWVMLGSALTWLVVGALLTAHRRLLGMAVGMLGTTLLALAADRVGGSTSGPLARSTLIAAGLVVAALLLAFTRVPALSLLPMLGMLGCGLALGAAGSAVAWIGAWVVAAACSLVILGPYGSALLAERDRLRTLAGLVAGVGIAAVMVAVVASVMLGQPWMVAGVEANWQAPPALVAQSEPDVPLPPPASASTSSSASTSPSGLRSETAPAAPTSVIVPASNRSVAPPPAAPPPWLLWAALVVAVLALWSLLLGLLLLAWFLGRRLVATARWGWLRVQLGSGSPEARVIGAWTWTRLRLARNGQPLPAWAAPDAAIRWASASGNPDLAALANLTAGVAFNPAGRASEVDACRAWQRARSALRRADSATLRHRIARAALPPGGDGPQGSLGTTPGPALAMPTA